MPADTGKISVSPNDVGADVEWTVENFFSLAKENGIGIICYFSPFFSFSGHKWCLSIVVNNGLSEYIDLDLIKEFSLKNSVSPISLELSICLKNLNGQREYEVHHAKVFNGVSHHVFRQFLPRSELSRRRSELLPHGALMVMCTLKDMTSAKKASNMASASAECYYCKGVFFTGSLSSHQKRCRNRPIKCPDCLDDVVFQKWLDKHECQMERPKDAESLGEVYKKVLLNGRHHDLILKVGGKELRAHRDILRAQSRVFESMLDHDMKEKTSGIIDVSDCDPHAMELFLSYVYCGRIEALNTSNMLELYYVADKYEMLDLKRQCCNFIKKSLSLANICNVIQLALNHSDSDLLEHITGYFANNMLDIMQTVQWQSFLKDNSTVSNELLMKSIKKLKNA